MTNILDTAYLHTVFFYADGTLFWKKRPVEHFPSIHYWKRWNSRLAGKPAGSMTHGYIMVRLGDMQLMAHRIVFCMFYGYMPETVDHKNMNRSDNRPNNLRPATVSENNRNRGVQKNNTTGFKGVRFVKDTGKYHAQIGYEGEYINLGQYDSPELASTAYKAAAEKYHGKFARVA